jgi:hypothetical protein
MKFGKSFEQALEAEDFPKEWVKASIQYKQLKVSPTLVVCYRELANALSL